MFKAYLKVGLFCYRFLLRVHGDPLSYTRETNTNTNLYVICQSGDKAQHGVTNMVLWSSII